MLLTFTLIIGGAVTWVWQGESTWISDMLERSRAHKDLAAMSQAFPQMVPTGFADGPGFEGRECSACANTKIRNELLWELTFQQADAKWSCGSLESADTDYFIYAFATAADAVEAVNRFRGETGDKGNASSGSRTDHHREQTYNGGYNGPAVVSTFP